jgi:uncharacterized Zn finger protein (UPF0148 family)
MASRHCPNCAAPLEMELGQVDVFCEYCASELKFVPGTDELEVVRTREEMKYRERVAVQQAILRKQLDQEEAERWRHMAGRVAIAALPVVGQAAGRAMVGAAVRRSGGGCALGCFGLLAALGAALAALLGVL